MSPLNDPALAPLFRALVAVSEAEHFDVLDALVKERGWVELLGADQFQVTQAGKHWYERWCEKQDKAARGKPKRKRRALSWRGARRG